MLFNSLAYLVFFPAVAVLHYLLPHRFRWVFVLCASMVFYMAWRAEYVLLLASVCAVNYVGALAARRAEKIPHKKAAVAASLILSFGLLFYFKYLGLFGYDIILPMGISFYTFQSVGYTIDVYRRRIPAEKNYFKFLLFNSYFPQLVAGPIERADRLMAQLFAKKRMEWTNISAGAGLLITGFFKKIVVADRLSVLVNAVYGSPRAYPGVALIIATIFFGFQIYCDFGGYSDIAVGSARILGVELTQNFKQPYFSSSVREFWRRWHISLSSWFKDYLYIPMGGSRVSKARRHFNTMVTFVISGVWHGANYTFFIWGALHGLFISVESELSERFRYKSVILTFIFVTFAWIFFRANSISDAFYIAGNLFSNPEGLLSRQVLYDVASGMGISLLDLAINAFLIAALCAADLYTRRKKPGMAFYLILCVFIMAFGVFDGGSGFIYFQF